MPSLLLFITLLRLTLSTKSPSPTPSPAPLEGRPFAATDITRGPFIKMANNVPRNSCFGTSVRYTFLLPTEQGTFRVPHSSIFMDGKPCGKAPPDATNDQLFVGPHMHLFPAHFLASEQTSFETDTNPAWVKFHNSRQYAKSFLNFALRERSENPSLSQTWVGFERDAPRICGEKATGQIILPQNALIFFGININAPLNLTNMLPRLTKGSVILRTNDVFHLVFTRDSDSDNPEHLCPQVSASSPRNEQHGPIHMCVPSDATVLRRDSRPIPMSDLRVGDCVQDGSPHCTDVYLFSHADPLSHAVFIELRTAANRTVRASPGHLIPTERGLLPMHSVRPGDAVRSPRGRDVVTRVRPRVAKGLFNAQTESGWLVVDGVVLSAYTTALPGGAVFAHAALTPVRAAYRVAGRHGWMRRLLSGRWVSRGWNFGRNVLGLFALLSLSVKV